MLENLSQEDKAKLILNQEALERMKQEQLNNQETSTESIEQKLNEDIEKMETYSKQIIDIPERQEKQIAELGGDTKIIEEKLKPEFNLLEIIRNSAKNKLTKILGILGLISMTETVQAQKNGNNIDILQERSVDRKENKAMYKVYDKELSWMNKILKSPEYTKRLTKNEGLTEEDVDKRVKRINQSDYYVVDSLDVDEETGEQPDGIYDGESVSLVKDKKMKKQAIGIHEFDHQSTDGNDAMSPYASNFYKEAFRNPKNSLEDKDLREVFLKDIERQLPELLPILEKNLGKKISKKELGEMMKENVTDDQVGYRAINQSIVEYLQDPTELAARKRQLDYFLEKKSIKKYGEIFTKKHYNILIELGKKGKLPFGIVQLLVSIKPEFFEEMMNILANNSNEINNQENHIQNFAQAVDSELINDQTASYFEEVQPQTAKTIREALKKSKNKLEEKNI